MSRVQQYWYMFNCDSSPCLKYGGTAFAIRSEKELIGINCPICSRECRGAIAWVADVDGGGGPDEPIVAYVRGSLAKIRNELFHIRTDGYEAARKVSDKLERLHGFIKTKWNEELKKLQEEEKTKED